MDEFFKKIDHLSISPMKPLRGCGYGNYRGKGVGQSLDFYGHRDYALGDDIRKINWKAYMRTQKLYIKEFSQEPNMHVRIVIDQSASMNYGVYNKFECAKNLCLGISYIALKQLDILSIDTFNNEITSLIKNETGKKNIYHVQDQLKHIQPTGSTDCQKVLQLDGVGGMTFVISDGWSKNMKNLLEGLGAKGHEVIWIHLLSQEEVDPDITGQVELKDQESHEILKINWSPQLKKIYHRKREVWMKQCENICIKAQAKYVLGLSNKGAVEILAKTLGGY